jgi:hypothetical protein
MSAVRVCALMIYLFQSKMADKKTSYEVLGVTQESTEKEVNTDDAKFEVPLYTFVLTSGGFVRR